MQAKQIIYTNTSEIAINGVFNTQIPDSGSFLLLKSGDKTAMIAINNGATENIYAGTVFDDTKDNADTINVYVETDVIKIQNKTAAAVTVSYAVL